MTDCSCVELLSRPITEPSPLEIARWKNRRPSYRLESFANERSSPVCASRHRSVRRARRRYDGRPAAIERTNVPAGLRIVNRVGAFAASVESEAALDLAPMVPGSPVIRITGNATFGNLEIVAGPRIR